MNPFNGVNSTKSSDAIIPIGRETVHRICSGQVVISLAIAVKELIENAIDASATIIDIRLKEYGSEIIEVSDNGIGVKSENFQNLTLKHYTSKLREFSDLESVGTLGFRGEALSSLCALSDLMVITKHRSASHATKITYDRNGKIVDNVPAARDIGTTVILQNLFSTLPVRRKDFLKNLKREFNKMCQLVYAYCLVSKGIKITCTNQLSKGSKNTVVATLGANTIKENIISVFGPKQLPSLIEIDIVEPDETLIKEFDLKTVVLGEPLPFKFEFLISSVMHGSGRSTTDRQFFYINSRPCEPQKITKLINEVYKQFNVHQYPFVFLNVEIERALVDVNVTPDKRQVFLENEKLLLAVIKGSLLEAFKTFPSTFAMQNTQVDSKITDYTTNSPRGIKRSLDEGKNGIKQSNFLNKFRKSCSSDNVVDVESRIEMVNSSTSQEVNENLKDLINMGCTLINEDNDQRDSSESEKLITQINVSSRIDSAEDNQIYQLENISPTLKNLAGISDDPSNTNTNDNSPTYDDFEKPSTSSVNSKSPRNTIRQILPQNLDNSEIKTDANISKYNTNKIKQQMVKIRTSERQIKEALNKSRTSNKSKNNDVTVRFRSKIAPETNKTAEQELQRQITKDMFRKMSIIGQFNSGFVIAKLDRDLFIIDQHATDEKYNFEQLQKTTVLESQVLVNPKPLELTAGNETILIDNEEVFKRNGFRFLIKRDAPVTKKVFLTSIPMSKNYTFGKEDIDEMLFMLQEDVNPEICRPSRIRSMFASRACRKSVMIGCPLSQSDMRRLVDHMGEIEHPWNCPHGRPTMRHLINLDLIQM